MINAESINTPIVNAAVATYRAFWPPSSECRCERVANTPYCCPPCTWARKSEQLQARIDESGLSIPVGSIQSGTIELDFPRGNPLSLQKKKRFIEVLRYEKDLDTHSRRIAQTLWSAGLPTFFVCKTDLVNLCWNRQRQVASDLMLFAPALVVYANPDENRSAESIFNLLHSRSFGIGYLIEQALKL